MKYKLKYLIDVDKCMYLSYTGNYSNILYNLNDYELNENMECEIDIEVRNVPPSYGQVFYHIDVQLGDKIYYGFDENDVNVLEMQSYRDYFKGRIESIKDVKIREIIE